MKVELRRGTIDSILASLASEQKLFDLVYIDADKKAYVNYLSQLLGKKDGGRCLLKDGALILVDNVLWKGLVLEEVKNIILFY